MPDAINPLPHDLVWTFGGSEVSAWQWRGDSLEIRFAVASVHGTLEPGERPTDGNLIPLIVRCEGVALPLDLPSAPCALRDGLLQDGETRYRTLPVPGSVAPSTADNGAVLALTLAWRQGGSLTVVCQRLQTILDASSRLIASWAC